MWVKSACKNDMFFVSASKLALNFCFTIFSFVKWNLWLVEFFLLFIVIIIIIRVIIILWFYCERKSNDTFNIFWKQTFKYWKFGYFKTTFWDFSAHESMKCQNKIFYVMPTHIGNNFQCISKTHYKLYKMWKIQLSLIYLSTVAFCDACTTYNMFFIYIKSCFRHVWAFY
jgi:hypothetical protein